VGYIRQMHDKTTPHEPNFGIMGQLGAPPYKNKKKKKHGAPMWHAYEYSFYPARRNSVGEKVDPQNVYGISGRKRH
jgi:hypothetical protein